LAGGAHHRDEVAERDVGAVVGVRVVDHVSAGFPERLASLDGLRRLPFQLEPFRLPARNRTRVRRGGGEGAPRDRRAATRSPRSSLPRPPAEGGLTL
jgi:hypothetical protein